MLRTVLLLLSVLSIICGADQAAPVVRPSAGLAGAVVKPAWATEAGTDPCGTWAKVVVGGHTQVLRLISAGTFRMGSENGDDNEQPVHTVTITQPFWLGDSEVEQGLWQAVTGQNPSAFTDDATRPVEQVSWDDCQGFIQRLNAQVPGLNAQLPTEAQWEYACRAGTTGDYAGDLDAIAWRDRNSGGQTCPVKKKAANAWGLYDMHGNVLEWCADWYSGTAYASEGQRDPVGDSFGSARALRGSSWLSGAEECRSAVRSKAAPSDRYRVLGLRLAARVTP